MANRHRDSYHQREVCFGAESYCGSTKTYRKVMRWTYSDVWFCRECDEKLEQGRHWWARLTLKLHTWTAQWNEHRVRNQLTARLRRLLDKEVKVPGVKRMELEQLAPMAGQSTEDVLTHLQLFEAKHPWEHRGYGYQRQGRRQETELERRERNAQKLRQYRQRQPLHIDQEESLDLADLQAFRDWQRTAA